MGLDQFAFRIKKRDIISDIAVREHKGEPHEELYYWRKVPRLEGFMERLFRQKGGEGVFNCRFVSVEADDLDDLEKAVREDSLPDTDGFFFGKHRAEDMPSILQFVQEAREVLREGDAVYYSSWW